MSVDSTPSVEASMKAHAAAVKARLWGRPKHQQAIKRTSPRQQLEEAIIRAQPIKLHRLTISSIEEVTVPSKSVPGRRIIVEVCTKYQIHTSDLMSKNRALKIMAARREACWRMRNETLMAGRPISFEEIGKVLGGLDHTTTGHHVRKYERMLAAEGGAAMGKPSYPHNPHTEAASPL